MHGLCAVSIHVLYHDDDDDLPVTVLARDGCQAPSLSFDRRPYCGYSIWLLAQWETRPLRVAYLAGGRRGGYLISGGLASLLHWLGFGGRLFSEVSFHANCHITRHRQPYPISIIFSYGNVSR